MNTFVILIFFAVLFVAIIVILYIGIALVRKMREECEKIETLENDYIGLSHRVQALQIDQRKPPIVQHETVDVSYCDLKIKNVTLKELAEYVLFNKPIQREKRTTVADTVDKGIKEINKI